MLNCPSILFPVSGSINLNALKYEFLNSPKISGAVALDTFILKMYFTDPFQGASFDIKPFWRAKFSSSVINVDFI